MVSETSATISGLRVMRGPASARRAIPSFEKQRGRGFSRIEAELRGLLLAESSILRQLGLQLLFVCQHSCPILLLPQLKLLKC